MNRFSTQRNLSSRSISAASIVLSLFAACSTSTVRPSPSVSAASPGSAPIVAIAEHGGSLFFARVVDPGCSVFETRLVDESVVPSLVRRLDQCPEVLRFDLDGALIPNGPTGAIGTGESSERDETVRFVAKEKGQEAIALSDRVIWNRGNDGKAEIHSFTAKHLEILSAEDSIIAVRLVDEGETLVRLEPAGSGKLEITTLSDTLASIDEVAVDDDEKELAISATRNGSHDIAIVNAEEPIMNWVPSDPAEEVRPRWSPLGYKLSYIVRNPGGDILRTVHVPTSAMVLADFPDSTIRDYAWLPDGERVLFALSSPLSSDHVVESTYTGESRRVVIAPEVSFDRTVDRIPGSPPGSLLLPPDDVRYTEKRPLVIWTRKTQSLTGLAFDPELVPLLERTDVGLIVVNGPAGLLGDGFWSSVEETRWVDRDSIWIVDETSADLPGTVSLFSRLDDGRTARALLERIDAGRSDR